MTYMDLLKKQKDPNSQRRRPYFISNFTSVRIYMIEKMNSNYFYTIAMYSGHILFTVGKKTEKIIMDKNFVDAVVRNIEPILPKNLHQTAIEVWSKDSLKQIVTINMRRLLQMGQGFHLNLSGHLK